MKKVYVDVCVAAAHGGAEKPVSVRWIDGRTYQIARTLHMCEASDNEFDGIRYTVLIGSEQRYIYRGVCGRWYVMLTA